MIRIKISESNGRITHLLARGHSGFAEHGKDIVCAGVSALLQALKIGLEELEGSQVGTMKAGFLAYPIGEDPKAQFLARVMEKSLLEIEAAYPKHLKIERGRSND